jgi:Ca2+-binding EF-hand superfamily protein
MNSFEDSIKKDFIMSKFLFFVCLLNFVFYLPHYAQAGDDDDNVPKHIQKKYDRRLDEMKTLDLNKDGMLQVKEIMQKPKASFNNADMNKDGILSKKEIENVEEATKDRSKEEYGSKSIANRHAMKIKNRLKNADRNDDDKVSVEEYESYFKARYGSYDRNGDGVITKKEYRRDTEKLPGSYRRSFRE